MKIGGVQPETLYAIGCFRNLAKHFAPRVTSIVRPRAKEKYSLHYDGYAFDAILEGDTAIYTSIKDVMLVELGSEFQIINHDEGTGFHLHCEYDPDGKEWGNKKAKLREEWMRWLSTQWQVQI
jgi:hypothetical protein